MGSVWGNKEAAVEVEEKLLAERERKEKKDLENLIQGLIGSKKSEDNENIGKSDENDVDSSSVDSGVTPAVLSTEKKEELKKQMWGMGKLKGTFTEAGIKLDQKLKSIAANAASAALRTCKDDKFFCNMKAKEEAEKRYGKLDDITFKAIKDEATENEIEDSVKKQMDEMLNNLSSDSGSTESSSEGETPDEEKKKSFSDIV